MECKVTAVLRNLADFNTGSVNTERELMKRVDTMVGVLQQISGNELIALRGMM